MVAARLILILVSAKDTPQATAPCGGKYTECKCYLPYEWKNGHCQYEISCCDDNRKEHKTEYCNYIKENYPQGSAAITECQKKGKTAKFDQRYTYGPELVVNYRP